MDNNEDNQIQDNINQPSSTPPQPVETPQQPQQSTNASLDPNKKKDKLKLVLWITAFSLLIIVGIASIVSGLNTSDESNNTKNESLSQVEEVSENTLSQLTAYSEGFNPRFLNNDENRKFVLYNNSDSDTETITFNPVFFAHFDNSPSKNEILEKIKELEMSSFSVANNPFDSEYYANNELVCDLSSTSNSTSDFITLTCIDRKIYEAAIESIPSIVKKIEEYKNITSVIPISIDWQKEGSSYTAEVYYSSENGFSDTNITLTQNPNQDWMVTKEEKVQQ